MRGTVYLYCETAFVSSRCAQPRVTNLNYQEGGDLKFTIVCMVIQFNSFWGCPLQVGTLTSQSNKTKHKKKTLKIRKCLGEKNNTFGKKIIPLFAKRSEWVRKKNNTGGKKIIPQRSKRSEWVDPVTFSRKKNNTTPLIVIYRVT